MKLKIFLGLSVAINLFLAYWIFYTERMGRGEISHMVLVTNSPPIKVEVVLTNPVPASAPKPAQ